MERYCVVHLIWKYWEEQKTMLVYTFYLGRLGSVDLDGSTILYMGYLIVLKALS